MFFNISLSNKLKFRFCLQIHFDTSSRYEIPRKNNDKSLGAQNINIQSSSMNAESTYESVGPSEIVYERKNNNNMKSSLPIDG